MDSTRPTVCEGAWIARAISFAITTSVTAAIPATQGTEFANADGSHAPDGRQVSMFCRRISVAPVAWFAGAYELHAKYRLSAANRLNLLNRLYDFRAP